VYRHIRRDIDKISRSSLCSVLELLAPSHSGFAFEDVNNALESVSTGTIKLLTLTYFKMAMMMSASLCISMNMHGACPQLLCTNTSEVDCSSTIHARGLSSVVIQRISRYHPNSLVLPAPLWSWWDWWVRMLSHVQSLKLLVKKY
jgi:hypothetical protein